LSTAFGHCQYCYHSSFRSGMCTGKKAFFKLKWSIYLHFRDFQRWDIKIENILFTRLKSKVFFKILSECHSRSRRTAIILSSPARTSHQRTTSSNGILWKSSCRTAYSAVRPKSAGFEEVFFQLKFLWAQVKEMVVLTSRNVETLSKIVARLSRDSTCRSASQPLSDKRNLCGQNYLWYQNLQDI